MPTLRRKRAGSATPPLSEIKLRRVVPVLPGMEPEKSQLMEDLTSMGCQGLANKPWGFREESVVVELVGKRSNQYDNTDRADPHRWTEELWRTVYGFRAGGPGLANRKDEYVLGKFRGSVNPKDRYAVNDCINDRERKLLQFLIPVLHPEKPTRVTITLGNTIFGSLSGDRRADWGRIVCDLVSSLASRVGKSRATPICPYLFHLYRQQELLTSAEQRIWRQQENMLRFGETESDLEPDSAYEDSEEEEEEEEVPLTKRGKSTPVNQRGTPPGLDRITPKDKPESSRARSRDPFEELIDILAGVRADWTVKRTTLEAIGALVNAAPDSQLPERVGQCITNPEEIRKLQAESQRMQEEVDALKAEAFTIRENAAATREMAE